MKKAKKKPQPDAPWSRDPWLWAITALAALLLLWNLGGRCLWQDEAETALLGRNILHSVKPVATDGINVVSQEAGHEFGPDHVWRWSPWVQFYLAGAGIKAFGATNFAARLPFALLGILVVPLTYIAARRVYASALVARFAALALATSPWFLLHARQVRWPAPAYLLACVVVIAVFELRQSWLRSAALAVAGAALFYTNYFVAICFLAAIAIASPLLRRDRDFFLRLGSGLAGAALLSLPGVVYFDVFGKAGGGSAGAWPQFWIYIVQLFTFLAPLLLVLIAVWIDNTPATRFLVGVAIATCLVMAFAPWTMFRYVSLLFPIAAMLIGVALAGLVRRNAIVGAIAVLLLVFTPVLHRLPFGFMDVTGTKVADDTASPLIAFVREIVAPPRDPECALADYLNAHAVPGDTLLITYGDLPLQFYTPLHVTGGLEGQPLPTTPDWIVGRAFAISADPGKDLSVINFINHNIDPRHYRLATTLPDPGLIGNPDPLYHSFETVEHPREMRVLRRVP